VHLRSAAGRRARSVDVVSCRGEGRAPDDHGRSRAVHRPVHRPAHVPSSVACAGEVRLEHGPDAAPRDGRRPSPSPPERAAHVRLRLPRTYARAARRARRLTAFVVARRGGRTAMSRRRAGGSRRSRPGGPSRGRRPRRPPLGAAASRPSCRRSSRAGRCR
jgi:hypothetical protein